MPPPTSARLAHIDALKLLAAHTVVGHHLSSYGPLSDALAAHWPAVSSWLYNDARMAVQIFLVLGGYLAARGMARVAEGSWGGMWQALWQRYLRLVLPYAVALIAAIFCAALARVWWVDEAIPAAPSVWQMLAHLLLLQDLTGHSALSTGVWYVAIDFQLFALLMLCARCTRKHALWAVLGLTAWSLCYANLQPGWDAWGLYFFGAYGLGALAYWASLSERPVRWSAALLVLGACALALAFRGRLVLALMVAVWLVARQAINASRPAALISHGALSNPRDTYGYRCGLRLALQNHRMQAHRRLWLDAPLGCGQPRWRRWPSLNPSCSALWRRMLPSAYALFLIHFPVCLLGNALLVGAGWSSPAAALVCGAAVWLSSAVLAVVFHERIERPLAVWSGGLKAAPAAAASRPHS
jgi:peptidoglycan/LPS O-acetylase OafA/YrhL